MMMEELQKQINVLLKQLPFIHHAIDISISLEVNTVHIKLKYI